MFRCSSGTCLTFVRSVARNRMDVFPPLLKPTGLMVIEDKSPESDELWFQAKREIPAAYGLAYFPRNALRQYRSRCTSAGIAVIVRGGMRHVWSLNTAGLANRGSRYA